jgi:hypothetical protein
MDFDGDGDLDIAALDYTNGRVALYPGKGDGTFDAATPVYPSDPAKWAGNIQVISSADFDGDGDGDVLAYDWPHASAGGSADLAIGLNDGTGKFVFKVALPSARMQELAKNYGSFSIGANTADFNGDRRADVIFKTEKGLSVVLSNRDGTLNPNPIDVSFPVRVGCMPFNYLATGDVNGDGAQDIIASHMQNKNCGPSASTPSGIFVLMGDGTGRFEATFTTVKDAPYFVETADLNGDKVLDLVVAYLNPGKGFTLATVPGAGNGGFNFAASRAPISGQYLSDIVVADYSGDGRADLILPTAGTPGADGNPATGTGGVLLLAGRGDFTFGEATKVLEGVNSISGGTAVADFDGDGDRDIVLAAYAKSEPYSDDYGVIVLHNENGVFESVSSELIPLSVTGRNTSVFVTDFNKDGAPDVVAGSGLSSPMFLNKRRSAQQSR